MQLQEWIDTFSPSLDIEALGRMRETLAQAFAPFGKVTQVPLPPRTFVDLAGERQVQEVGTTLRISRPGTPSVMLCGHYDTVPTHTSCRIEGDKIYGTGSADMKGGIYVLLQALPHLLDTPLGWEIWFTPDEEIGSPGSRESLMEAATRHDLGLIFEPALPGGALVGSRHGSARYTLIVRGRAAHAGRDFSQGKSAIHALASAIDKLAQRNSDQLIVNVGEMRGGVAANIVAPLAGCCVSVRAPTDSPLEEFDRWIRTLDVEVHGGLERPAKPLNEALFASVRTCGAELGMNIEWGHTAGVCDGNLLQKAGLPTIDTLGVLGAGTHSTGEYALLSSIAERTRFAVHLLKKFSAGQLAL